MKKRLLVAITTLSLLITIISTVCFGASTTRSILKGSIEDINYNDETITILDYDGKTHTIDILPSTRIEVEEVQQAIYDLYFGQEVDVILEGDEAKKVIAYPEEDPGRNGYIMPGSRFRTGRILFLTEDTIEIKGKDDREKYRITPYTTIYKNGGIININQVKEGDKVVLTFDDIYRSEVSTIRVQDQEEHITGVLRGKIYSVDERKEQLHLMSPYTYKEGRGWIPYGNHVVELKVEDNNLYNGGEEIDLKDLNKFRNKEIYVAFDSSYGKLSVAKLQVKNGASRMYQSPIENIEYGTGKMIVDKNLIHFNPGTIVIEDDRLVDVLNINRYKDVFVNTDIVKGSPIANLVAIEGTSMLEDRLDGTKISIYRGKIEDIFEYEVEIGKINYRLDYQKLTEDNKWVEQDDSQRFGLTDDTLIYDSELNERIPANYFIKSRFIDLNDIEDEELRDRVEDNFYKNKAAYFVVRESDFGKELLAMNITPHINKYRYRIKMDYSVIGEIREIDYDENNITFTEVKNYNTLNDRWENGSDETIELDQAVILLNDLPIPQDKLYTIRPGTKAYIIKNKQSSHDTGYVILLEN
ncbi:hypothetical protein K8M07_07610 [Schnuerera sp. xch1]|uniref:hypothetical protein n=1 Tax=Schnuerera sp. xch1 TaxID=2874283 RepID=UPI001CC10567|nr:hypothetical protein [Schnuerera sp. xch1]MBZ2175120.1 hypothetical protein [Schnuerera sp. xch1]